MTDNWQVVLIIMAALIFLDALILSATYFLKLFARRGFRKREKLGELVRRSLVEGHLVGIDSLTDREWLDYFLEWYRAGQSVTVSPALQKQLGELINERDMIGRVEPLLKSRFLKKRALGINLLLSFKKRESRKLLYETFRKEPSNLLRLKIIQYFCESGYPGAADLICDSMKGSGENYATRVLSMLRDNVQLLTSWADENRKRDDPNAQRILIQAARMKMRSWYHSFLLEMIKNTDKTVACEAAEVLAEVYGDRESLRCLLASDLPEFRRKAAYHYFRNGWADENETAEILEQDELHSQAVSGLKERIGETPRLIPELFIRYQNALSDKVKRGYGEILSSRIQYFILRLKGEDREQIRGLLGEVISLGLSAPIINFLNANKNMVLEKELLETLATHLEKYPSFLHQCQLFLKEDLKEKLGLSSLPEIQGKPKIPLTKKDRVNMFLLVLLVFALPIGSFVITRGASFSYMTGEELFISFLLMYHHIFAYYTISINVFYLFLMVQSWIVIKQQMTEWKAADQTFLNARGLMPSVSILAPAYNEETTIVQNVYSLLSLNYPNLEVIVINDGSRDRTIQRLVDQFDLKLVDFPLSDAIRTAPVLGLYKNDRIPNLIVMDKKNGGKADALNVGLNAAGGDYVCSIDADSLLEPEALTKLMFRILNSRTKTVAIGGNIIPVNGCLTKNGSIREIHLADNRYARYQTIEYLRSFITGRLGWARMKGLMIISGAFGAFSRKDVLDIGGYMTGTGTMGRDTVGEDMELVVRLIRHLNERGEKFRIDYSHNANCWTEVPEKLGDLLKQRDRWHRGLIEILLFHKKMLLNRKYGSPGLLAFPYLFLFELLGPFWEFFGYIVLLLSLLLGLMSGPIFLFMFSIVVLFGILISSASLYLTEREILYFQGKEFLQAMATVIEENFGYRQFVSMHRVYAFVAYLFRNKGWQKLTRKGFAGE